MPWSTERDRILMERPRALPPARPAPSAHSFLPLSQSSPGPAAGPAHPTPRANTPRRPGAWGGLEARGWEGGRCGTPRGGPGQVKGGAGRGPGALRGLPGLGTGTKRALAAGSAGAVLETGVGRVARRGWLSWERVEIKGEFNPFVARGSSSQSSPGLTGRGKRLDQSLIRSAPLTFHLLPASLQFWQGASVTFPPVLPLSDG